jgi:PRTRC genetic system protein E
MNPSIILPFAVNAIYLKMRRTELSQKSLFPAQIQLHPEGTIPMFKELGPLLRHRAVLFTVSYFEDDKFRVNVIPKKASDGENDALVTPVSVTGTVEDLYRELPQTLVNFVSAHLELKNTLERAQAEMDAVSKAVRAEVRKKSGNQAPRKDPAEPSSKPAAAEAPARSKAQTSKAASLFDSAQEPARVREAGVPEARTKRSSTKRMPKVTRKKPTKRLR